MKTMSCILIGTLALTACQIEGETLAGSDADDGVNPEACPVIESRDWRAWIDAMPRVVQDGQSRVAAAPTLHVTGVVDLPTPGYEATWRVGAADRMMPPGQHLHLSLTSPSGMVTQVVTPTQVRYRGEASYPNYRVIIVHCGDDVLAEIGDIITAR